MTSLSNNYAFIHIPKNAGTSIREALHGNLSIAYFGHDVRKTDVLHRRKIYIMRDPVDRFTSAFYYLKRQAQTPGNRVFRTPEELLEALASFDMRAFRAMRQSDEIQTVYGQPILTDWVFAPQHLWVWDPWWLIDFDAIEAGVQHLAEITDTVIALPHLNRAEREPFAYSEDSLIFLKAIYRKDFELHNLTSLK